MFFTFILPIQKSTDIPLPQISLPLIFQSCCFQVPGHPIKPSRSPSVTEQSHIQSLILLSKVNNQVPCLKFCQQGGLFFSTVLQEHPSNEIQALQLKPRDPRLLNLSFCSDNNTVLQSVPEAWRGCSAGMLRQGSQVSSCAVIRAEPFKED